MEAGIFVDALGLRDAFRLVAARDFAAYLRAYAGERHLQTQLGTTVTRVTALADGGFTVVTDRGPIACDVVVNATGYFACKYVPDYELAPGCRIPRVHSSEYIDADAALRLAGVERPRVLIVGKRISAGQIIEELYDAGCSVTVSHRTPIAFTPSLAVTMLGFPFYYAYEDARIRREPFFLADSNPPIEGGRIKRLLTSGRVATHPDIARIGESDVTFTDGTTARFDLIVFCTGYRPALAHLSDLVTLDARTGLPPLRGFESAERPGLFFLGTDRLRSFRSRYLRGIREDAVALADALARRQREPLTGA